MFWVALDVRSGKTLLELSYIFGAELKLRSGKITLFYGSVKVLSLLLALATMHQQS